MPSSTTRLRLLATSDLHANLMGWDYHRDLPNPALGLLSLADLIHSARAEVPMTLLLDNGDFLQGSALGDWAAETKPHDPHHTHPMIAAMNALGFDAANIGNHEFSHGLPLLRRAAAAARFPLLSANLALDRDQPFVSETILTRHLPGGGQPLRIGLTGIAPPQTAIWESRNLNGALRATDPVPAAAAATRRLRYSGADIVILLAHTGIGDATHSPMMEDAAIPLSHLPEVDALILGHAHRLYPTAQETLARPAVMPGCFGSHLGCIDLDLVRDGDRWRIQRHDIRLLAPDPAPPPIPLPPSHEATRAWLRTPAGATGRTLHAHFARIVPSDLTRLIATAQADHVRRHLDPAAIDGRPILSAAAPFRSGGRNLRETVTDISPGPLTLRHLTDIYPHPNTVIALALTGQEVADWLERAVHQFRRITPGSRDADLIDGESPAFDFDLIDGLSFGIDLDAPARFDTRGMLADPDARRITDLRHAGQRVRPQDRFILATNSYRADGSGGFAGCHPDRVLLDDGTPSRAALARWLADHADLPPTTERWALNPLPGTTALIDAPTGADSHLDAIARFRPEILPRQADTGLHRFRLHL